MSSSMSRYEFLVDADIMNEKTCIFENSCLLSINLLREKALIVYYQSCPNLSFNLLRSIGNYNTEGWIQQVMITGVVNKRHLAMCMCNSALCTFRAWFGSQSQKSYVCFCQTKF